jgi:hypothetical protein
MSAVLLLPLWFAAAGADAAPPKDSVPREEVRRVVAAIVEAARENLARKPGRRLAGDALADYYVRRAAAAARAGNLSPRAFLLGLGVALDDTDYVRRNPLTRSYLRSMESDAERDRRLAVIGRPSLRGRHDWVLHFAVSAAIAAHSGVPTAEQAGLLKELLDSLGSSGFSFGDLAADYAGTGFAARLLGPADQAARHLREAADHFEGNRYLPAAVHDLEEDIPWKRLTKEYGDARDPRLRQACDRVHKLVLQAPGFREDGKR